MSSEAKTEDKIPIIFSQVKGHVKATLIIPNTLAVVNEKVSKWKEKGES